MDTVEAPQVEVEGNLLRLKSHLKSNSLAEKLVSARISTGTDDLHLALRKVVQDRIEELRHAHEPVPNQQA